MTPEERRKIYEEEKARIEAQQPIPPVIPPPAPPKNDTAALVFTVLVIGVFVYWMFYGSAIMDVISPGSSSVNVPSATTPPPKPAPSGPQLSILSERGTTEHGYARVNGQVKNLTGQSLKNVTANVSWFDSKGQFVKSDDALIDYNPILPGQTSTFEVLTSHNPEMKRFRTEFKYLFGGAIPHTDASAKK